MNALTLAALAATPRWVAWMNELRDGKLTKAPYSAPGRKAKADDPATWRTRAQAESVAKRIVNGNGGGIGIVLGELGDGIGLGGVDLDTCRAPDGPLTPWAAQVVNLLKSYTETSPSLTGAKVFFRYNVADLATLRERGLIDRGDGGDHKPGWGRVLWKEGSSADHPPSIELYLGNRYFATTNDPTAGAPAVLRLVTLADLEALFGLGDALRTRAAAGRKKAAQDRSAAALRKGAALRRAGKTFEQMVAALRADPETADWCRDKGETNRQRELRRIWEKAASSDWVDPTEDAVAQAFAAARAGHYVYDHTAEVWKVWQSGRWQLDARNTVFNAARDFARAARERLDDPPASMAKVAFAAAVERGCRSDPRLAVSHEVWDSDPWLLGVPGGIVDLKTGWLGAGAPDLYISRQTSVAPAPVGTPAPLWQRFLEDATRHDKAVQAFLQRLAGYILTGLVNEEVLIFLYGPGGNGKGVFIGALSAILAEYAAAVPIELFTAGSRINPEYYRAQIAGVRLVTASETEAQATWSQAHLTEATGNEVPLSARRPYGRPFTYWPQFKVVLIGNYAPKLKGRSPAMERRLRIAPFNHKPDKPDPDLKAKLKAEHPAILRWMIDGCLMWQHDRLGTAPAIAAASASYFDQQDAFRRWIEECCILDESLRVNPGPLLAAFNAWAKDNGEETMSSNSFAELIERTPGLSRKKTDGARLVQGIGLKAAAWERGRDA